MLQEAEFIVKSIRLLDHYFEKSIQKKAEGSGVTIPQMRVIKEVVKHQGISIKQLSQNLNMTQSTVSGIVERLINKDLLIKKTNPQDKRFAEIWYTKQITEFLENSSSEFISDAVKDIFQSFKPNELETITKGLHLLLSAMYGEQ